MRVIVCGGREFTDQYQLYDVLDFYKPTFIISGHARGADKLGEQYAEDRQLPCLIFPADWKTHGKAAGPIRNTKMLVEGKPDKVIAFPGGTGTANMIKQSKKAGVVTIEVKKRPKCYILVGLSCSGKSYWTDQAIMDEHFKDGNVSIFSTDDIIESICKEYKITYNQGWPKLIDFATFIYNKWIDDFFKKTPDYDAVFDRTNLTKKSRKIIIDRFKKTHEIIVNTFAVSDEVRAERMSWRFGKEISNEIINDMKTRYEPFTVDELS